MNNIEQKELELINEFSYLSDRETILDYLISLGSDLENICENEKIIENEIHGCVSKVWVISEKKNNLIYIRGDSNSLITKGLLSILVKILSGNNSRDILNYNIRRLEKMKLSSFIGSQRLSGFENIFKKIKSYALSDKFLLDINIINQ